MCDLYDCHIHSIHSHDSVQTLDEVCEEAIEKGVKGIAITDHVDFRYFDVRDNLNRIKQLIPDVQKAKEKYEDRLKVFCGVELGEYFDSPHKLDKIMSLAEYDVVLGSVHRVGEDMSAYAKLEFDSSYSDEALYGYLAHYFDDVEYLATYGSFDVLTHLTCPLRYMVRRYKRNVNWKPFSEQIKRILSIIINRNIALEVNTAGYDDEQGYHPLPDREILQMYYDLGGRLLTLGSDSHRNRCVANRFDEAIEIIKAVGFEHYCYFENRKPVKISIKE